MSRWFWVRHGPTHEKAFTGWRDVPADLSDTDRIARLDAFLPKGALLLSSDLRRARDTALALAEGRAALRVERGLREFDFGAWDGLRFDAIAARDPDLSRRFWEEPGTVAPPGGESWDAVAARVTAAADAVHADHPDRDVVAVAHIGAILTQIARAKGISASEALGQTISPLSVTVLERHGDGWSVGPVDHAP